MKTKPIHLALTAFLTLTTQAQAADTGTLILRGVVPAVNNIVVTPNGSNNTTLDVAAGVSNKLVASVLETSNTVLGYKINVKSANGSELRNTVDASKKTNYQLSYNGASAVSLSTNYQMVKNVTSLSGLTNATSNVQVSVTAFPAAWCPR